MHSKHLRKYCVVVKMRKLSLLLLMMLHVAATAKGCLKANESLWQRAGRQKRYLVFEKGGSFGVQANIAKAIISERPRGLNQIAEFTLVYDLPQTVHVWLPKELLRQTTTTTKSPTTTTTAHPWPYWQQTNRDGLYTQPGRLFLPGPHDGGAKTWQRHDGHQHYLNGPSSKTKYWWCRRQGNSNNNAKKNYGWCKAGKEQPDRRHGRSSEGLQTAAAGGVGAASEWRTDELSENFFYDVLGKWSKLHGYNGRYCVMRTLCESRYLLMPQGHSLFHDMVRIMVRFALPTARRHRVYKHTLDERTTFEDCSRLYGPHCRLSFLEHFTKMIHPI